MARSNLSLNPCLSVNSTDWTNYGSGSVPTRAIGVTGFPDRTTAALYTSDGFIPTAPTALGACSPGLPYTLSVYVKLTVPWTGTAYVEWLGGGGGVLTYDSDAFSLTANVASQVWLTKTAPASTAACRMIVENLSMGTNTCYVSQMLIEQSATLNSYGDGDSPGWTWDGTAGNSASTLPDAAAPPMPRQRRLGALIQM